MDLNEKLKELKTKLNETNRQISFYKSMINESDGINSIIETFNIAITVLEQVKDALEDHIKTIKNIMEK